MSYFLSRENVIPTDMPGMALWREKMFAAMARNAGGAVEYFNIPTNRVIEHLKHFAELASSIESNDLDERAIRLVLVNGVARCGEPALMDALGARAERVAVGDQLRAVASDQEHDRSGGVAQELVAQLDPVDLGDGHQRDGELRNQHLHPNLHSRSPWLYRRQLASNSKSWC